MDIKLTAVNFDASSQLEAFVNQKVEKLTRFFDHIIGVEVILKLEKDERRENKQAKIKVLIPGSDLFAEKQAKSFEEAVDNTVDALRNQIVKYKERIRH